MYIHAIPGFPSSKNVTRTPQSKMKLVSVASRGFSWKSGIGIYDWISSCTAAGATLIVTTPADGAQICSLDKTAVEASDSDATAVLGKDWDAAGDERPDSGATASDSSNLDEIAVVGSDSDSMGGERTD
jgi:hypothetical protein